MDLISGYIGWKFQDKKFKKYGNKYHILYAISPDKKEITLVSMERLATMTFADFIRLLHRQADGVDWARFWLGSVTKRYFPDPRVYEP